MNMNIQQEYKKQVVKVFFSPLVFITIFTSFLELGVSGQGAGLVPVSHHMILGLGLLCQASRCEGSLRGIVDLKHRPGDILVFPGRLHREGTMAAAGALHRSLSGFKSAVLETVEPRYLIDQ